MAGEGLNEDEKLLKERELTLRNDKRRQAEWYESLNLYAEAMKVFESIQDQENIVRLREKMRKEYGKNARSLEDNGRFQDAANLYYLIGDNSGVRRMKELKPDLVILYDSENGGLAKLASTLDEIGPDDDGEDLFSKPNVEEDGGEMEEKPKKRDIPIKKPAKKKEILIPTASEKRIRFCPYCGEELTTKKEPRFCPFCGEDIS